MIIDEVAQFPQDAGGHNPVLPAGGRHHLSYPFDEFVTIAVIWRSQ
jgi:hypothetical protein